MPAFGRIRTRALTRAAPVRAQPLLEGLAGDPLVGFDVAAPGPGDDLLGDRRGRRALVPAAAGGPVADVLLVEARLAAARLVVLGRPVARGVGRQDLVADDQLAGRVEPELELGVGQDHAVRGGRGRPRRSRARSRRRRTLLHQLAVADQGGGLLEVDRLVVADVGLRRGREDRLGQLLGLLQARGQRDPRDRSGGLVVLPAGAGDVAADDALDRQHLAGAGRPAPCPAPPRGRPRWPR